METDSVVATLAVVTAAGKINYALSMARRWGENERYRQLYRACDGDWWCFMRRSGLWVRVLEASVLSAGSAMITMHTLARILDKRLARVDQATEPPAIAGEATNTTGEANDVTGTQAATATQMQQQADQAVPPAPRVVSPKQKALRAKVRTFLQHFTGGRVLFALFLAGSGGMVALMRQVMEPGLQTVSTYALPPVQLSREDETDWFGFEV